MRLLLLVASMLLIIIVVGLHAVGGIVLLKTGLGDFSVHNPLGYILIGLSLVFAVFKLKHIVGVIHRKNKGERRRTYAGSAFIRRRRATTGAGQANSCGDRRPDRR